jgi:antitoxin component HigA of HigAB toxin-antitoxin module
LSAASRSDERPQPSKVRRVYVISDGGRTTRPDGETVAIGPDDLSPDDHAEGADVDQYGTVGPEDRWQGIEDVPEDIDALRDEIAKDQESRLEQHGTGGVAIPLAFADGLPAFDPDAPSMDGTFREDMDTENAIAGQNAVLRENAPQMMATAIQRAAESRGLTADDVRAVFGRKGRPSTEIKARRELVREVLRDTWDMAAARDSSGNRSLMADVLGCSREALYALMAETPTAT